MSSIFTVLTYPNSCFSKIFCARYTVAALQSVYCTRSNFITIESHRWRMYRVYTNRKQGEGPKHFADYSIREAVAIEKQPNGV